MCTYIINTWNLFSNTIEMDYIYFLKLFYHCIILFLFGEAISGEIKIAEHTMQVWKTKQMFPVNSYGSNHNFLSCLISNFMKNPKLSKSYFYFTCHNYFAHCT